MTALHDPYFAAPPQAPLIPSDLSSDEKFEECYRRKLDRLGVERIAGLLRGLSDEEGGRDLVLLCYEADPGQRLEELENSLRGEFSRRAVQQRLFDTEGKERA